MKLLCLLVAMAGLRITASAQSVFLSFSGGNNSPFTINVQNSLHVVLNETPPGLYAIVFEGVGKLLYSHSVYGSMTMTYNGSGQSYANLEAALESGGGDLQWGVANADNLVGSVSTNDLIMANSYVEYAQNAGYSSILAPLGVHPAVWRVTTLIGARAA